MQISALDYLHESVKKFPNKVAITQKNRTLSYSELWTMAHTLAQFISTEQKAENRPIAVYLPKSLEAVISFVGILLSGNFYCPLDVRSPLARTEIILSNLSPSCVITNQELAPKLAECGWPSKKMLIIEQIEWMTVNSEIKLWTRNCIDTDPIYVIYTSGSTGIPKGVVIPHRGVVDYIDWALGVYSIKETDVIGNQAPLFFDNSTLDIYACFAKGATLELIPEELFAFPIRLIEYLANRKITFIFWVPSVLTLVANADSLKNLKLPNLKSVLFAGEAMPARTLNYWRRHHPSALYSNLYGPTEITVDCTYYIFDREISDDEVVPIGQPCRNTDVFLLDENNRSVSGMEVGELCVRGSSIALGYWNAPEATNVAFVTNPLCPEYHERIYKTGDLVKYNKYGELIFLGRKDSQIKHHGFRVELGEIEAAASNLNEVSTACVLYSQATNEIVFFYEATAELPVKELRERLGRKLPKYMLPSVICWLTKMPLTQNGKTDRVALTSIILDMNKSKLKR
jgi:D-alanine--poly(phosphoribitol) ligase subunit 1